MEYYIYVTNDCNLNCSYCSVLFETNTFQVPMKPIYTTKDLESFITKTQNKLNDGVADIYFFGGEPTMNYQFIYEIMLEMDSSQKYKRNFILHSNGLLINKAPFEILDRLDLVLISINYEKIYTDGKLNKYWGQIIEAIEIVKRSRGIPVIGRLTISNNTSLFTECSLIGNCFDYIYWQIENLENNVDYENYEKQFKFETGLLFNYWLSFFKSGVFLNYVPFISVIKNYLYENDIPQNFFCGYGESMIYVQTNGNCFACCDNVESQIHLLGNIYDGISLKVQELNNAELCKKCEYLKVCGGRCGRMHKEFSEARVLQYCDLNKHLFILVRENLPLILETIQKYPEFVSKINDPILKYTEFTA